MTRAVALASSRGTLADDLVDLGRLSMDVGQFGGALGAAEAALGAAEAALAARPDHVPALLLKAHVFRDLKRDADAAAALDLYLDGPGAAEATGDGDTRKRFAAQARTRGLLHVEAGDFRRAVECFCLALRVEREPDTLSARGWAFLIQGALPSAREDFQEALAGEPDHADARMGLANVLAKQGQPDEAAEAAEESLRGGPETARYAYNAARVFAQVSLKPGGVHDAAGRAASLLEAALRRIPEAERSAFWSRYVAADPALEPLRKTADYRRLELMSAPPRK